MGVPRGIVEGDGLGDARPVGDTRIFGFGLPTLCGIAPANQCPATGISPGIPKVKAKSGLVGGALSGIAASFFR